MADTNEFFSTYLPEKIAAQPDLKTMGAVFQFDIKNAGNWTVRLDGEDTAGVSEGTADDANCVITTDKDTWEGIIENPGKAMQAFMMGKLKASNIGLATKLQQILD
ncbi:MAG: SCP2 sterol-binding domain-containing protein [Oligoflexia bacterium]|nr:SCP2 sterol-binding domain-containing protein [Oligoflexia bacterium]